MRIVKILMIVGIAVVLFVVGAAIVLMSMDFNEYKPEIAAEVKKATGRDMAIDGDLKLNLLTLNPGLEVDGVKFQNASWGSRSEMAIIKRFEVKVSLLPLLSGNLDVDRVVIDGADILIERNRQGQGNYEFDAAVTGETASAPAKSRDKPKAGTDGGASEIPSLQIRQITIEDSRVTYKDAASNQTLVLGVETLAVSTGAGDLLKIDMKGSYNGEAFTVTGETGELAALLKPTKPWPVSLDATAGGAKVNAKGSIAFPAKASGIDLTLNVKGDDLSEMSKLAGAPVPPLGPYALSAKVTGSVDKAIEVNGLTASMGKSSIAGEASLDLAQERPSLTAKLSAYLIDLNDVTVKTAGASEADGKSASGSGGSSADGSGSTSGGEDGKRLFPADPLPFEALKAADAKVELTVQKLVATKLSAANLHTVVELRNGDLAITPLTADVAKGKISGAVHLKAAQPTPSLNVKFDSEKIDIGNFLAEMEITDLLFGVVDTDIAVQGRGKSVRQIMAGLNGKTSIVMGEGRMKSSALDTYVGGAATVLAQLVAGKKSEYTVINCFLNQFDIKNGVATSKIMLFDTEYAQVRGAGTINLKTEQIKYSLDPKPKSVTVTTAVPVEVTGPLADPKIGVNPLAAAGKIGGLIGTVVFPPAAVVTLGELGVGDDNACMKQASGEQPAQPAPEGGVKGIVEGVEKKLDEDVKKKLDEGLKKLFGK